MNGLLDKSFLNEIGVNLADTEYQLMSDIYETALSDRVVSSIVSGLSEPQLEQLHEYRSKTDEDLQNWLKTNVPELKDIIENEIEILLGEIAENSQSF